MAIQWSVLYKIFKTNTEPTYLCYHTTPYHAILFIWYQKTISLMPDFYNANIEILVCKHFCTIISMTTFVWMFVLSELFSGTGWSAFENFHPLGYFWKLIVIFREDEVAKRNCNILGYFSPPNQQFQIELCSRYFGIFWRGNWFGCFWKIGIFFQIFWSPCSVAYKNNLGLRSVSKTINSTPICQT